MEAIFSFSFSNLLLWIAALMLLIQLFYIFNFFFRVAFHKENNVNISEEIPFSIVIASRSEAHHLIEFLPYIFNQDYKNFEVIVVNDRSWDDTKDILKALQLKHANLKVVQIEEGGTHSFGKKMAVTLGIKAASHEHIITTDADCKPVSNQWLKQLNFSYQSNKNAQIVLGISPYQKRKGFLNRIIRYDGFWTALHYIGMAKAGIPYMGVGRNLSYQKELFFKVGGFKRHYSVMSGDDDLLVQDICNKKNVAVCIHPESFTLTLPKEKWSEWTFQKKRHFSTSPFYKLKYKLLLGIWPITLFLFYASCITLLVLNSLVLITLSLLAFRTLLVIFTFIRAGKRIGQNEGLWLSPIFEIIQLFVLPFLFVSGKMSKVDKWK